MINDDQFKDIYNAMMDTVNHIIEAHEEEDENIHLVAAGVLTTMGLSMYKSCMSEKDFNKMLKLMIDLKNDIKAFNDPEFGDRKSTTETFH